MLLKIINITVLSLLCACSSVSMKSHSLDKTQKIYVDTNGEKIRMAFKDELEKRGYDVTVGTRSEISNINFAYKEPNAVVSNTSINGARYIATIHEYPINESMVVLGRFPVCMFNGWSWWDFSLSIADNKTGKEILNWSGMGCKGTVINQLQDLLNDLEK